MTHALLSPEVVVTFIVSVRAGKPLSSLAIRSHMDNTCFCVKVHRLSQGWEITLTSITTG